MKKLFYLIFLFTMPLLGQNDALFEAGNAAYNNGNYEAAIENYEEILNSGETSDELYYNLGNAHYKLNNIAPSIYYYEKALQLNPNDQDIKNNIEFARNMAIDDIEEVQKSGFTAIWKDTVSVLDYNEWGWLAISLAVMFSIFFLIYYFSRKTFQKRLFFTLSMIAVGGMLFAVVFAFQQKSYVTSEQFAVIFTEEAEVRSEPTQRSEEIFTLHEGTKIEIIETYQDWVKFELANGLQGWTDKSYLKFL
ncbi:tetratricopeptide repeat protein [Antarcticibacterium sp. 1MA-6-2]|uniref:tetratricopeptide repeat protein n=1 Tax=Antarcticibacterium sp. 1MA-6-2 TaxID=2908210 RepID=UPI001F35C273|nr:tetratricopeptide repeat protein [Antarcticibacterium sp. 1MA-6-2]UJH90265.1 tetratricopeptide repeat protein [Antarcticibacterium sp. 1MA-6-2]